MRLDQMASRCKRRGGDCPCQNRCEAEKLCRQEIRAAILEKAAIERRLTRLELIMQRVESSPATLKDGFTFREGLTPVMVFDGEEACFGYEDADGEWIDSEDWPFNESYVWTDDCKRHGIRVE